MRSDTDSDVRRAVRTTLGELVRFTGVGAVVAALSYAGFLALYLAGLGYIAAMVTSAIPCMALSYVLNRTQTFRVGTAASALEGVRFVLAAMLQVVVSLAGMACLVEIVGLPVIPASIVNVGLAAAINFAVLKCFVFAKPATVQP